MQAESRLRLWRSQEYIDKRCHQPEDEVQTDWDHRGTCEDIELYYAVGLAIADGN